MESPRRSRQDRPLSEQHDEWMAHLRRQPVSRRSIVRGAVGAAAGSLLLGAGAAWSDQAVAAVVAGVGTIAGGFVVNGRHLVRRRGHPRAVARPGSVAAAGVGLG